MAKSHNDGLLTPSQVADLWQVSLRTVQRYIAEGKLKAIRLPGGQYRVNPSDADAAIEQAS
jgi:excisionase family DNA binding protein